MLKKQNKKKKQYLILLSLGLVFVLSGCFNNGVKDNKVGDNTNINTNTNTNINSNSNSNINNIKKQSINSNDDNFDDNDVENNEFNEKIEKDDNVDIDNSIKYDENGEIDTSDWLTYRNEEYGFEVKYPKNLSIDEYITNPYSRFSFFDKKCVESRGENEQPADCFGIEIYVYNKPNNGIAKYDEYLVEINKNPNFNLDIENQDEITKIIEVNNYKFIYTKYAQAGRFYSVESTILIDKYYSINSGSQFTTITLEREQLFNTFLVNFKIL